MFLRRISNGVSRYPSLTIRRTQRTMPAPIRATLRFFGRHQTGCPVTHQSRRSRCSRGDDFVKRIQCEKLSFSKKSNKAECIADQIKKNTTKYLDKNYANLKLCSSEPSIAFTPSKARRAMRAKSATHQVAVGKTRDAKKRIPSFLLAHSKIVLQNRKNMAQ